MVSELLSSVTLTLVNGVSVLSAGAVEDPRIANRLRLVPRLKLGLHLLCSLTTQLPGLAAGDTGRAIRSIVPRLLDQISTRSALICQRMHTRQKHKSIKYGIAPACTILRSIPPRKRVGLASVECRAKSTAPSRGEIQTHISA